jgi:hypothetical protein
VVLTASCCSCGFRAATFPRIGFASFGWWMGLGLIAKNSAAGWLLYSVSGAETCVKHSRVCIFCCMCKQARSETHQTACDCYDVGCHVSKVYPSWAAKALVFREPHIFVSKRLMPFSPNAGSTFVSFCASRSASSWKRKVCELRNSWAQPQCFAPCYIGRKLHCCRCC